MSLQSIIERIATQKSLGSQVAFNSESGNFDVIGAMSPVLAKTKYVDRFADTKLKNKIRKRFGGSQKFWDEVELICDNHDSDVSSRKRRVLSFLQSKRAEQLWRM